MDLKSTCKKLISATLDARKEKPNNTALNKTKLTRPNETTLEQTSEKKERKKKKLSIKDKTEELVSEFDIFDNSMDRYEYIIELGKALPSMEESLKTEERLVKGCQSKVWLSAKEEGGKVFFMADSNTVITKGIIAILIRIVSGERATDISENDFSFINQIDLRSHLSSQRSNGLTAMIGLMKQYAVHYSK